MKLEEYISILKPEVEKMFESDKSGHDTSHLKRTMHNALLLQKHVGGDEIIVGIAAYLHDVHRIMQQHLGRYVSPKESLPTIEKMLAKTNLTKEQTNQILHCIEMHEVYNWHDQTNKEENIETLILQDADNLDAIGAVGVIRAFNYGAANNIPFFDETTPIKTADDYQEKHGNEESTIHHFYHKLFKLGKNMNTKYAKHIAKKRIKFMKKFVKQLLNELY